MKKFKSAALAFALAASLIGCSQLRQKRRKQKRPLRRKTLPRHRKPHRHRTPLRRRNPLKPRKLL